MRAAAAKRNKTVSEAEIANFTELFTEVCLSVVVVKCGRQYKADGVGTRQGQGIPDEDSVQVG